MSSHSTAKYKPVPGFKDRYRVGNDGSVWTRLLPGSKGKHGPWRQLKPTRTVNGYTTVSLCGDGRPKQMFVHRLILMVFVGPPPAGTQACHGNGIRHDNRRRNLRWDTPSANHKDKKHHGRNNDGERNGCAKLRAYEVKHVRWLYATGRYSYERLGQMYGVSGAAVSYAIKYGWRHIR